MLPLSNKLLAFILLAVLGFSLYFIIQAEGGVTELPRLVERVCEPCATWLTEQQLLPSQEEGPVVSQSPYIPPPGAPGGPPAPIPARTSFGGGPCLTDAGCFVGGCSEELCTNTPDALSTCEFNANFPSQRTHSCGCIDNQCAWTPR